MMTPIEQIHSFYTAFANGDSKGMADCYHHDILFHDPGFGYLKGEQASKMWEMLISRRTEHTKITLNDAQVTGDLGRATWTAEYVYGATNRKVVNVIQAQFRFQDGKIIEHTDHFSLWKWSRQALGLTGLLIGWTPFMKRKIQQTTNQQLREFMKQD